MNKITCIYKIQTLFKLIGIGDIFMDLNIEKTFVEKYVNKDYKKRLIFEFETKKNRQNAIMRFCHNTEKILDINTFQAIYEKKDVAAFMDFLTEEFYYVLSFEYVDGIVMRANDVINYICDVYFPVLVLGNSMAIVKKEFEKGTKNFFLLKNK